ncbi:amidohydrolase [Pseudonocardiaceae bacterium YIM PH 21723]|nr:amidohydrolase [Pseudonocardiaceae bacterium YIM PH 21723]
MGVTAAQFDGTEVGFPEQAWRSLTRKLLDLDDERIAHMDASGIELSVLSVASPGAQGIPDRRQAVHWAARANDVVAARVAANPSRFAAFAVLPMQDPAAAARELRRAVTELGMCGAMVHSFSQVDTVDNAVYYDGREYWGFWATVEQLGVPIYLHPRKMLDRHSRMIQGHPWLATAAWSFAVDTTTHALRLMGSGLFDRFPGVQVVLGHLGEMVPFTLWRTDHWMSIERNGCPAQRPFAEYFANNFHVTISAVLSTPRLEDVIEVIGTQRVLYATDYPYESMEETASWWDALELDPVDRTAMERGNAIALLGLNS